ncbi:MAG: hypothetical protein WBA17_12565 [Saprospiraceae bacterium]
MSLKQAGTLLEKISNLQKSMTLDADSISPIERDIMLSYVRQLYEAYLELDLRGGDRSGSSGSSSSRSENGERATIRISDSPAPPRQPAHTPPPAPETQAERRSEPSPAPARPNYQPPVPQAAHTPPAQPTPAPQPRPTYTPAPEVPTTSTSVSPKVAALFQETTGRELSDRLANQPVSDLTRAMAINDRLLYANQLFAKDGQTLNTALSQLNQKGSFDNAKTMLADLAEQYDWMDDERRETAVAFIKLVRRRYA